MPWTAANAPGNVVMQGTPGRDGRRADVVAVRARSSSERCVDHEVDPAVADHARDVVRVFTDLRHPLHGDPCAAQHSRRATGGDEAEPEVCQSLRREHDPPLGRGSPR